MRSIIHSCILCSIIFFAFSCKNETTKPAVPTAHSTETVPHSPTPIGAAVDTIYGFDGMEKASMKATSDTERTFTYQKYTVKITDKADQAGETVVVTINENANTIPVNVGDGAAFFAGICHDQLLMDKGTGPDGRELYFYDLKKRALTYSFPYIGEPTIKDYIRLYAYKAVKEADVTKMPDCPEKSDWSANGLGTGYGQRLIYDLGNGSVTIKSEFKCFPVQ